MGDWSELKQKALAAADEFGSYDPAEAEIEFMSAIKPDVILALIAENERLQGLACAVNSAMHEAGMPVGADPADLADVIHRLQVQAAALQKNRTELNMEAARLVEDADEMAADLVAARNKRDQLRSENEQQKEQIENFKVQFYELHVARNLLSTLSGAGFPLDEGVAESILAVRAERDQLRAEIEAMASLLRRFVENEHNPDEDQNERHWYHGEAETLLAKIGGEYQDYALVPEEALQKMVSERDQLRAEVEQLKSHRTDWQAKCLKRGFEYVREPDNHYVLADTPEMAVLLGELLGVEVRSKDNDGYGETASELREQLESANASFHRAYELEKENEALRKDAERYRWLRSAENDVAITFGIHAWEDLSDEFMDAAIDAAMGKGGRADG